MPRGGKRTGAGRPRIVYSGHTWPDDDPDAETVAIRLRADAIHMLFQAAERGNVAATIKLERMTRDRPE